LYVLEKSVGMTDIKH